MPGERCLSRIVFRRRPEGRIPMIRADLHVHSRYSTTSNDWMMKRLGASESYTEPETIYRMARSRGMNLVTITDHNPLSTLSSLVSRPQAVPQAVLQAETVTASREGFLSQDNHLIRLYRKGAACLRPIFRHNGHLGLIGHWQGRNDAPSHRRGGEEMIINGRM